MSESILNSTKNLLGLSESDKSFDPMIINYINSALSTLTQLGVGPETGYSISGEDEEWAEFSSDAPSLGNIKIYVYVKVRLLFDPPTTSFAISALEKQAVELEWRINSMIDPGLRYTFTETS